jgi:hypothetical protein
MSYVCKYEETDETRQLHALCTKPTIPSGGDDHLDVDISLLNVDSPILLSSSSRILVNQKNLTIIQNSRDSDDDDEEEDDATLKPYDLSNDTQIKNDKQPAFLRDCLDSLIYTSDDVDKIEMSLKSIESLCNTYHYELSEVRW